jgi:hypothetical protein
LPTIPAVAVDHQTAETWIIGSQGRHKHVVHSPGYKSAEEISLASLFGWLSVTQRIEQLIVEVKEKEKLESELEIARQVQAQLFPKQVPKLATLQVTVPTERLT